MSSASQIPNVGFSHLDQLWFQVAGTLCNLTCEHCFISCSPKNDSFGFLSLEQVKRRLEESVSLGVKEYYFTGGEPFLNRDMVAILEETLRFGPATVLTNGTVFKSTGLRRLATAVAASPYSLEFRVSIDGFTASSNDPIRGTGTFDRAMRGVMQLVELNFLPIITAARTWPIESETEVVQGFIRTLQQKGYKRPRIKILPTLQMGAEEHRTHGYRQDERVTQEMMQDFEVSQLICEHSRIVSDRGVHVCPILIESSDARLSDQLSESLVDYPLRHGACFTCYQYGSICSNPSSSLSTTPET
ncbi:MAG: radical SAM protein [Planctomycetaceae bacterium]|nr:radical SAM protein [Planctomycetaceae bacterium]